MASGELQPGVMEREQPPGLLKLHEQSSELEEKKDD
jgi:hypothetical protein